MRRIVTFLLVSTALSTSVVLANNGAFTSIDSTVGALNTSGKGTLGTFGAWFFGLLPLISFIGIGVGGYRYASKKAEQDQDTTRVAIITFISAILGFFVGVILAAVLGAGLMGSASEGVQIVNSFWRSVLTGGVAAQK